MDERIGQRLLRLFGFGSDVKVDAETGSKKEVPPDPQPAEIAEARPRLLEDTTVERFVPNPFLEVSEPPKDEIPRAQPIEEEPIEAAHPEEAPVEAPVEEARPEPTEQSFEAEEAREEEEVAPKQSEELEEAEVAREPERDEDPEREKEEPALLLEEEEAGPIHDDRHEPRTSAAAADDVPEAPPVEPREEPDASRVAEENVPYEERLDEVTEKTEAYFEEEEEIEAGREPELEPVEERDEEDRPGGAWVLEEAREEEHAEAKGLRAATPLGDENRCHGTMEDGTRCLRKPIDGKAYCREHAVGSVLEEALREKVERVREESEDAIPRTNFGSKIIV